MIKKILVLTGLNQETTLPIFKLMEGKLTKDFGVETKIFDCAWKKRKNFREIENDLSKKIEEIRGEVVLVAISAGMIPSLMARNKYGKEKIPKIISLCGWSRPKIDFNEIEERKFDSLRGPNPVFGEAVGEYTKIYKKISLKDWRDIMIFWAENDEFVPKSCCIHEGAKLVELKLVEHVSGILLGLSKTKEIKEFMEKN